MFTMKTSFHLFLLQTQRNPFGSYTPLLLLPPSNLKADQLWIPLQVLFRMSQLLLLAERRNFREPYTRTVLETTGLVMDRQTLAALKLIHRWHPFEGEHLITAPHADACFPLTFCQDMATRPLCLRHYPSLADGSLMEWHFTERALLQFFLDPRFRGLLVHAGFRPLADQLQLDLIA
jgi:hypothetical protein